MPEPGQTPIPIKEFRGLLILPDRTNVPPEFSPACKNAVFVPGGVGSRPGLSQRINLGGGTDVFHMEIALRTLRYHLLLMDGPGLYYSKEYAARTALKTSGLTGVNHFRQASYGTRTFFTFSDSDLPKTAPFVWTSQGVSDFFDGATEAAPSVGTFAAADGAAGSVTAGVHKFILIYETRSGYQTSPSAPISYTAPGSKKVDLSNITTGGGTISKRLIGMTKAGGSTYFLAATINDNSSTTLTVDISDATLIQQTDLTNWFQFKHPLPDMKGVIKYGDRMVYWGIGSTLWISEKGLPATVRADVGFRVVALEDGDDIRNCIVMGGVLYIFKSRSIHALIDNGDDVAFWADPRLICSWAGCLSLSGIATTTDKQEAFFLDVKGLYRFNGGDPQMLSDGIQPYWKDDTSLVSPINHSRLVRSECVYDPQEKRILLWVPTGSATEPNQLLVGDVREGYDRVKWCPWESTLTLRSFAMDSIELNVASAGALVYKLDETAITDGGSAIDWFYEPGVLQPRHEGINLLSSLTLQVTGAGILNLSVYNQDHTLLQTPAGFTLSSAPGKDLFRRLNLRNERFFVRFGQNSATASAKISGMSVDTVPDGVRAY